MAATKGPEGPRRLVSALLIVFGAGSLHADDLGSAGISVYSDDDGATVVSPHANANMALGERVSLRVGYDADVITAATVDVRTSATPHAFEDVRHGARASARVRLLPTADLMTTVRGSIENDYDVLGGSVLLSNDFLERTLTLQVSFGMEHAAVGRASDAEFAQTLWTERANVAATIVLDPRTVASLSYSLGIASGFQANPYRFVPIFGQDAGGGRAPIYVTEALPTVRDRHAMALELRHAIDSRTFVAVRLGGYADGWGIEAGSLQAELTRTLMGRAASLRLRSRGYLQSAARFHEERYSTWPDVPLVRSGDRELGAMSSFLAGLGGEARLARTSLADFWLRGGADILIFRYHDFAALERRMAVLLSTGLVGRL